MNARPSSIKTAARLRNPRPPVPFAGGCEPANEPFKSKARLAVPVWAHDMSGNPDMQQSIRNAHDSHFPHQPGDSHEPEKGSGDSYGSVLLDAGSHTPHRPGDNHEPEKGRGDTDGAVLHDVVMN